MPARAAGQAGSISEPVREQLRLARRYAGEGQFDLALPAIERLPDRFADTTEVLAIRAQIWTLAGLHDRALTAIEAASARLPDSTILLYNLALARRACGDQQGAISAFDEVIVRNPTDWAAWKNRSDMQRWSRESNHVGAIRAALAQSSNDPDANVLLGAALSKELYDLGDNAGSFDALTIAAGFRRRQMTYDVGTELATMQAIAQYFSRDWIAGPSVAPPSDTIPTPIFVVGMPRSGSTLLERILAASPQVDARGEMPDFPMAMVRKARGLASQQSNQAGSLPELAAQLDLHELGQAYRRSVAARKGAGQYFVDKLPMNFLNIGLIRRALPDAKIIHIYRQPRDVCFAIYRTFFGDAHPYSYAIDDLADYYAAYRKLMEHWRLVLPTEALIEVAYEDLVAQPIGTASSLFKRLGLGWDPAYVEVEKSRIATDTASASQVNEAIHTRSVAGWRAFQNQLEPLFARLAMHGVDEPVR